MPAETPLALRVQITWPGAEDEECAALTRQLLQELRDLEGAEAQPMPASTPPPAQARQWVSAMSAALQEAAAAPAAPKRKK